MSLLGSASRLQRAMACPASCVLPHEEEQERSVRSQEAIDKGHAVHLFLELVPEMGKEAALLEVPERWRKYCAKIDPSQAAGRVTPLHNRELAFAYDIETREARVLPVIERQYGDLKPTEIPGTADVVVPGFRLAEVWDYKTGKWPVPEPRQNSQLLFLGLCTVKTVAPRATHVMLGLQTLKGFGRIENKAQLVDRIDLDDFEDRVHVAYNEADEARKLIVAGSTPRVVEGDHCSFCPAAAACPAKKGTK